MGRHVNRPEQALQIQLVRWCRLHPVAKRIFHVPNGGKRTRFEAGILHAMGVSAGIPDLMLPVASGGSHGLFIEMKAGDGRLSEAQSDRGWEMAKDGYAVLVVSSLDAGMTAISLYLAGKISPGFFEASMIGKDLSLLHPGLSKKSRAAVEESTV